MCWPEEGGRHQEPMKAENEALDAGKGKETNSLLQLSEGMGPC